MAERVILAAMAGSQRVIGRSGQLPWPPIPEDMERFKTLTWGHPVLMGGRTWREDLGRIPLPGRQNIIISSQPESDLAQSNLTQSDAQINRDPAVVVFDSIAKALDVWSGIPKLFIIGGATIYTQTLPLADTLELTLIDSTYEGDTFFPAYEHLIGTEFVETERVERPGYQFVTYRRIL